MAVIDGENGGREHVCQKDVSKACERNVTHNMHIYHLYFLFFFNSGYQIMPQSAVLVSGIGHARMKARKIAALYSRVSN